MERSKIIAIDGLWYSELELVARAHELLKTSIPAYRESFWRFILEWFDDGNFINLKTSGSTGVPKVIAVGKVKIIASARRTISYLGLKPRSRALICLSCEYVAGKMMVVRALEANMEVVLVEPTSKPYSMEMGDFDFAAMVPLQIIAYKNSPSLLNHIAIIIVGGAALTPDVADVLSHCPSAVYETYGMTETVSHIALRLVSGASPSTCFTVLKGVTIKLDPRGCLEINDGLTLDVPLVTNDLVELASTTTFRIIGRIDNIINSGGIKISPEEVETQLKSHLPFEFAVSWIEDLQLGQRMVLVSTQPLSEMQLNLLNEGRDKYFKLNRFVVVKAIPRTQNNKLDRVELHRMVQHLQS